MASSIKDVATRAGISIATVSRAVNTPERVSASTLARVQAAMDALHYRPNALGRQLRAERTGLLGVVLPSLANPVFAECMQGIEEAASITGQRVMLMTTAYDREREARAIETMLEQRVDGLILTVADAAANPHLDRLDAERVPYVLVYNDTYGQPRIPARCCVTVDNRAAARDAIRALLAQGHRQIRMLTGTLSASDRAALRHVGYREALEAAGIAGSGLTPVSIALRFTDTGTAKISEALEALTGQRELPAQFLREKLMWRIGSDDGDPLELARLREVQRKLSATKFEPAEAAAVELA